MQQRKTLYTLAVNNYAPEICRLTFPLMRRYAKKIGAEFYVIKERKYDEKRYPPVYEKFQIYDLAKEHGDDWSIYFDADTLIHPDFWDVTANLNPDTTLSGYTSDYVPQRFKPDEYFKRDGRFIGKGNWFSCFSNLCHDYVHPLFEIKVEDAIKCIVPIESEVANLTTAGHLLDDWLVSRNIARFGLKHTLLSEQAKLYPDQMPDPRNYIYHNYTVNNEQKKAEMQVMITNWVIDVYGQRLPNNQGIAFKPLVQGKTMDEKKIDFITKCQKLADSWMEGRIDDLKFKWSDPTEPIEVRETPIEPSVDVKDGELGKIGGEK